MPLYKSDIFEDPTFGKINLFCVIRYQMTLTSTSTLKHTH